MVAVDDPDPPQEAKFNELSPDNEAHAKCFGVLPFMNIMATPVSEQRFPNSPTIGEMLRVQEVIIERLRKKLCQIEVLKQRVLQGCELDAAQREKLGREDELLTALEEARDVAETAFAVPQPIRPKSPQQPCATEAQLGPTSQHEEPCSDLVQRREELSALVHRPQQPSVAKTQIGPKSPRKRKKQSALVQRPQQPRAPETQIGPVSQCEHEEPSALVQRPQQPRVAETQLGPMSPCKHEEPSALVQRPQQPRVAQTQIGPGSPREREEQQSALAQQQQQQPHATEAQPEPRKPEQQSEPEPQKPEPQSVMEPQSKPVPGDPKPRAPPTPGEPKELRVETKDDEPDHWKPGGFEPRAFDPGGSTEQTVRMHAHNSCSPLRVRLRLRGDG